ncbi:hypothetical protein MBLNU13_g01884t1 [Cladosporium sp. NU13]
MDAHRNITPMIPSLIGETPDTIHHSLGVRDRARFVVQILFNLLLLGVSRAELVEFAVRIDGFIVAHGHIPVTDIRAAGGVFNLLSIPDGMTGTVKTAEFRALTTSASADGEDVHTLFRAQQVGQIQVDIRHEWGTPITDRSGSLHTLSHDGSYSIHIRDRTRATYYTHYDNPTLEDSTMIAFVHDARFGRIGHFVFLYNSEEFVARLNRQPRIGTPPASSVHSILPDRMSTGHLTRGAMSIIPPDLHYGDIGISVTPHTAGAQSTGHTSTAQRSSIDIGGGLVATPTKSSHSRPEHHDSVAPHNTGAQLTASHTLQQPGTDTGGGSSATPSYKLYSFLHDHIRGFVPPPASAPDTSSTQSPGAYPIPDFHASGRPTSSDRTFNNRYSAIRPRPQPADAHPNDRPSTGSANRPIALEPSHTAREAPSQAQASTGSARAGASSSSAAPETHESWGTRLRETVLAESASHRPLSTPATGGYLLPPFQQYSTAPVTAGRVPSRPPTSQAQPMTAHAPTGAGMTEFARHGLFGLPASSRPPLTTQPAQDGRQAPQSNDNAAATFRRAKADLKEFMKNLSTTGSAGPGSSPDTAILQAQSTAAPAEAGVPSLPVDPQAISAAATDSGGVSSLSGAPQATSITDASSDSSGGPPRKERKLSEKESKGSQRRTKK